jgi:hypothetical protein
MDCLPGLRADLQPYFVLALNPPVCLPQDCLAETCREIGSASMNWLVS